MQRNPAMIQYKVILIPVTMISPGADLRDSNGVVLEYRYILPYNRLT